MKLTTILWYAQAVFSRLCISRPTYLLYLWIIFSFNKPIKCKQHDLSRLLSIKATDQIGAGTWRNHEFPGQSLNIICISYQFYRGDWGGGDGSDGVGRGSLRGRRPRWEGVGTQSVQGISPSLYIYIYTTNNVNSSVLFWNLSFVLNLVPKAFLPILW